MHFENPFLLFGLLGGLIPIIIHLIHRRKAKPVAFAALAFLLRTNKKVARNLKLKQWLILLMRILLICAIPVALSRPFSTPEQEEVGAVDAPLSAVIILDNSISMNAISESGDTALERAKEKAKALVNTLSAESNVAVVEGAGECRTQTSELTFDRAQILNGIDAVTQRHGMGRPEHALRIAEALLARSSLQDRRIVYISDLQSTDWLTLERPWSLEPPPSLQIESIGPPPTTNAAIKSVEVQRAREVSPAHIRVSVSVEATGQNGYEGPVSIQLGNRSAQNTLKVDPGAVTATTFLLKIDGEETPTGEAWIGSDQMTADDRRSFSLQFNRHMEVLVINGAPRNIPYRDELFFLEKALQDKNTEAPIRMTSRKVNEVKPAQFKTVDVVVLANVLKVPEEWIGALQEFIGNGGGLLFSGGDNVTPQYNDHFEGLLPMPVRAIKSVADESAKSSQLTMMGLAPLGREHPALRVFQSVNNPSVYDARFHTYVLLDGPTGGPRKVNVLGTYSNGAPFLVESQLKRGRILFWSNTLDQDWGSLPIQTSYVPLIRNLLLYLGDRLEGNLLAEAIVGEDTRIPFRGEDIRMELSDPEGKIRSFELLDQDARRGLFVDGLERAGLYEIAHFNKNDPNPRVSYLPVHHPYEESSVDVISPAQILGSIANEKESGEIAVQGNPLTADPSRTNLWPYILVALFGLLAFEAILAVRSR